MKPQAILVFVLLILLGSGLLASGGSRAAGQASVSPTPNFRIDIVNEGPSPQPAPHAPLSPALQAVLAQPQPPQRVAVIVHLHPAAEEQTRAVAPGEPLAPGRLAQRLQGDLQAASRELQPWLRDELARGAVSEVRELWIIRSLALEAAPIWIERLRARPQVAWIDLDQTHTRSPQPAEVASVEPNLQAIGAEALWALGARGQGVVVALLDTGAAGGHPALAPGWRGGENSWYDPYGQWTDHPVDLDGHGTQVLGVMAARPEGDNQVGVAPEAQWIAARIYNNAGQSSDSAIHQAFQWLLDPDGNPDSDDAPDVVNNSWGQGFPVCDIEFEADVNALRSAGILPVFAAGNYGPDLASGTSPAVYPASLAVGSVDAGWLVAPDSSRGPSLCDGSVFPALVAPGVGIRSTFPGGLYDTGSGTSLAAPHVSGGAALLLSAFPGTATDMLQQALQASARDLGEPGADNTYGYGGLDLAAAYHWLQANYTPPPSPTPTLTPTASPSPTPTATVTPTPEPGTRLVLPWVVIDSPLRPPDPGQ